MSGFRDVVSRASYDSLHYLDYMCSPQNASLQSHAPVVSPDAFRASGLLGMPEPLSPLSGYDYGITILVRVTQNWCEQIKITQYAEEFVTLGLGGTIPIPHNPN